MRLFELNYDSLGRLRERPVFFSVRLAGFELGGLHCGRGSGDSALKRGGGLRVRRVGNAMQGAAEGSCIENTQHF